MNIKSVVSSALTVLACGLGVTLVMRPTVVSGASDANTSRQGRLDHVTACNAIVSTDPRRHRHHLPLRNSAVWVYFFARYTICEEDRCSAWRPRALRRMQYFRDHPGR